MQAGSREDKNQGLNLGQYLDSIAQSYLRAGYAVEREDGQSQGHITHTHTHAQLQETRQGGFGERRREEEGEGVVSEAVRGRS
jgi:hypothetical protein